MFEVDVTAKFCALPITTTSIRFLVQVIAPIPLVTQILEITAIDANGRTVMDVLKEKIAAQFTSDTQVVSSVTLSECELVLQPTIS